MREPKSKNRATRVNQGGIHAYVPKDKLELALASAGIPLDAKHLEVRAYPCKGRNGRAGIMLHVRQIGPPQ